MDFVFMLEQDLGGPLKSIAVQHETDSVGIKALHAFGLGKTLLNNFELFGPQRHRLGLMSFTALALSVNNQTHCRASEC